MREILRQSLLEVDLTHHAVGRVDRLVNAHNLWDKRRGDDMHRTNDIRRARQVFATNLVGELRVGGEADHRQRTESGEDAHG